MTLTTIKFTIKPDGDIEEEVKCVENRDCQRITSKIENKLGDVIRRVYLP